ncbi:MAG: phosphate signaling complex protein PhoU [Nitrososphaerota archaeon]|nr:phosphate signaling complex protein PhoU [Nitrososphaerota archaeon]
MSAKRPIDEGLDKLRGLIGDMINLASKALRKSIKSTMMGTDYMNEVKRMSDELLFIMDEVSELVVQLLIRFQPVASDLREIKSALQASYDLSRIGRYAANICEITHVMPSHGCDLGPINDLSKIVIEMVDDIGHAYLAKDLAMAEKVRERDDEVDRLYAEHLKKLIEMGGKMDTACILSMALILRYLERIADHACYIADALSYSITGRKQ